MKCDTCKNKLYKAPGHWFSVADGTDDPYGYDYCDKQGWSGWPIVEKRQEKMKDPWEDCKYYEKRTKEGKK